MEQKIGDGVTYNGGVVKIGTGLLQVNLGRQTLGSAEDLGVQLFQGIPVFRQAGGGALHLMVTKAGPDDGGAYAGGGEHAVFYRNNAGVLAFPGDLLSGDQTEIDVVTFSYQGEGDGGNLQKQAAFRFLPPGRAAQAQNHTGKKRQRNGFFHMTSSLR